MAQPGTPGSGGVFPPAEVGVTAMGDAGVGEPAEAPTAPTRQLPANGVQGGGLLYSTAVQAMGLNVDRHSSFIDSLEGDWGHSTLTEVFQVKEDELMQAIDGTRVDGAPLGAIPKGALRADL
eukprot:2971312-Pyramimonas_sp.AAC.1